MLIFRRCQKILIKISKHIKNYHMHTFSWLFFIKYIRSDKWDITSIIVSILIKRIAFCWYNIYNISVISLNLHFTFWKTTQYQILKFCFLLNFFCFHTIFKFHVFWIKLSRYFKIKVLGWLLYYLWNIIFQIC